VPARVRLAPPSRRAEILDIAFQQLVAHGFEGLRIREIAQSVGINQATLLYHFGDKEELIVALVDDLISKFRSFNEGRFAIEPSSFSAFEAHLRTLRDLFSSAPEIYVALNEISVRALRHPKIAAKLRAVEDDWGGFIATLLSAAAPHAEAKKVAALALSTVIFVRGLNAKMTGDGTLTILLERGTGHRAILKGVAAAMNTFIEQVVAALR
jgi:AcrR family transcriptional regulator